MNYSIGDICELQILLKLVLPNEIRKKRKGVQFGAQNHFKIISIQSTKCTNISLRII